MTARELHARFVDEAETAYKLSHYFNYDDELKTQYAAEARAWRQAADLLKRELLHGEA